MKITAPGLVHAPAGIFFMVFFLLSDLCYITYTAFHLMFTLRHSVEIAPDKINVFIKSCTISLKLNDGLHYSPLFIQLKRLIYKIQFPLIRPSMIYVNFFFLGLWINSVYRCLSHLLCVWISSRVRKINTWLGNRVQLLTLTPYSILNPKFLTLALGILFHAMIRLMVS